MKRRDWLRSSLGLAPALVASRVWAGEPQGARLLMVFLRGGYDSLSLLVPRESRFYREVRPNIALPVPDPAAATDLHLDADWTLHPALTDTVLPLYRRGQALFLPFSGIHNLSRSHFETQDAIEMGQAPEGPRNYASGFLNRLAAQIGAGQPIAFTEQLPLVLRGEQPVATVSVRAPARPVDARQRELVSAMYRDTPLAREVAEGFAVREQAARDLAGEMAQAGRQAVSARGFELEARRVARLMRDRHALGFIDVGGWDTHVGQGAATGALASRFEELGRGLAAFAGGMGPLWEHTLVVVLSEFGRTVRENGNRGTDHGHGTVYWLLGGAVRGGRVAGEQVRLERQTLFQDRDCPVLNEYRAVLGGVFQRLYGLNTARLERVFPGATPAELGLV